MGSLSFIHGIFAIICCIVMFPVPVALYTHFLKKNGQLEREFEEIKDKRRQQREERDSIRRNFDLQRTRMYKMSTEELIAFSQAAAAEVNKRRQKEMMMAYCDESSRRTTRYIEEEPVEREVPARGASVQARSPISMPVAEADTQTPLTQESQRTAIETCAAQPQKERASNLVHAQLSTGHGKARSTGSKTGGFTASETEFKNSVRQTKTQALADEERRPMQDVVANTPGGQNKDREHAHTPYSIFMEQMARQQLRGASQVADSRRSQRAIVTAKQSGPTSEGRG